MLIRFFHFPPNLCTEEDEEGVAPDFTQPLKPKVAQPNQVTELRSVVIGKPVPVVKWYRNNKEIIPDESHLLAYDEETGQTVLTILNTSMSDECVYTVEATNTFGKAKCKANVVLSK